MIGQQPDQEPALFGDLARFSGTDVLQFFGFLGITGVLEFTRGIAEKRESVEFLIHKGRLIGATCSAPHVRLGELLVRRYDIALDVVLDFLRRQQEARNTQGSVSRIGELLLAAGYLEPKVLQRALDDAATRVACRVLTWKGGEFAFWPNEAIEKEELSANVGLEDLVLERWHATETYS